MVGNSNHYSTLSMRIRMPERLFKYQFFLNGHFVLLPIEKTSDADPCQCENVVMFQKQATEKMITLTRDNILFFPPINPYMLYIIYPIVVNIADRDLLAKR